MDEISLHSFDGDEVDLNSCIIGRADYAGSRTVLSLPVKCCPVSIAGDGFVVLRATASQLIAGDDMVASPGVLRALGYSDGDSCVPGSVRFSEEPLPCLSLSYRGYHSKKHWDEFSTADLSEHAGCWSAHWPQGLSKEAVALSLPGLLSERLVAHGCLLLLPVLSVETLWQVSLSGSLSGSPQAPRSGDLGERNHTLPPPTATATAYRPSPSTAIEIAWDSSPPSSSSSTSSAALRMQDMDWSQQAWQRIHTHCMQCTPPSALARSLLLSAPAGAGKTVFLHQLQQHMMVEEQGREVIYASARSLAIPAALQQTALHSEADHLTALLALLGVSSAPPARWQGVLLLDDLDLLWSLFRDDKEVGEEVPGEQEEGLRVLAYRLHGVLEEVRRGALPGVCVVGAGRLDPAQLGRAHAGCPEFALTVSLLKPSQRDRQALLLHLLGSEQWAQQLAPLTRGYGPGDLCALLAKAQLQAAGRGPGQQVQWADLLAARAQYTLLSLRSLDMLAMHQDLHLRDSSWACLAGCDEAIAQAQRSLRPLLSLSNTSSGLRGRVPRGAVLHGPSGCGKTLLGRILAKELGMNLLSIRSTDLLSKYFGQTEARIRDAFRAARRSSPCLFFLDDFTSLAHRRGSADAEEGGSGLQNRVLSTLLNELDGVLSSGSDADSDCVFVLAACRDLSQLDEALLRPGRLHEHIHLPQPSPAAFAAILQLYVDRMPCSEGVSAAEAAQRMQGRGQQLSGALAEAVCRTAQLLAIEERIQSGTGDRIEQRHLEAAIDELAPPACTPEVVPAPAALQGGWTFSLGT